MRTILCLASVVLIYSAQLKAHGAEAAFGDFPFMVHCENAGTDRAYYLAKIEPNGMAIYISPDNLAGAITLNGPAEPIGGDFVGSCAGKTLEQLRSAGQAFDLD
jgi:hypothetical protein